MKQKLRQQQARADILAAAAFILCAVLAALVNRYPGMTVCAPAVNPMAMIQPDSVTEEAIPDYAGIRRTYSFTLKDNTTMRRNSRVYVYLHHARAAVRLDGELYYDGAEWQGSHIGDTPGSYWLSFPLRLDHVGKTLEITLTPVYGSASRINPVFYAIDRDALLNMLVLPKDLFPLALSITAISSGCFLALLSLFLPFGLEDKRRLIYLGAVTAFAGLWKLCGLPVVALALDFTGLHKTIWYTGAASYLITLPLSLCLMDAMRQDGKSRSGIRCAIAGMCAALLVLLLQMACLVQLHDLLIWYGLGMALLHLVSLVGQKTCRLDLLWLLPFFLSLGADLLIYCFTGSIDGAPFFLLWILVNLFIRGFGFVRGAIKRERLLRDKEEELHEAKIQCLVRQIEPHFIYNTLTSAYYLCQTEPQKAMDVIEDFSSYLKANFSAITAMNPISFSVELNHTRAYLNVQTMRYVKRLSVNYELEYTDFRIPALTLQPIVENAIKHGVEAGHWPEEITIRSRAAGSGAEVEIEDNGPGYAPAPDGGVHIGLQNVRERLSIMCGGTLDINPRPGGGTVVKVFVPID